MKNLFSNLTRMFLMFCLSIALGYVDQKNQQALAQVWGAGYYGAGYGQACQYQQSVGSGAFSIDDDIADNEEEMREARSEFSEARTDIRELDRDLRDIRNTLYKSGIKKEYLDVLEMHVKDNRGCYSYVETACKLENGRLIAIPGLANFFTESEPSRMPAQASTRNAPPALEIEAAPTTTGTLVGSGQAGGTSQPTPAPDECRAPAKLEMYTAANFNSRNPICGQRKGSVNSEYACALEESRAPEFNKATCERNLNRLQSKIRDKAAAQAKFDEAKIKVDNATERRKELRQERRELVREEQRERRREMTEGGSSDMRVGGGGRRQGANTGQAIASIALGVAGSYLGYQNQRDQNRINGELGFPGQSPWMGATQGFPYILSGVSGLFGGGSGGGVSAYGGAGAFGCGIDPSGGMFGPGGVGGYPRGYYPNMGGGGILYPGNNPYGYPGGGINGGIGGYIPGMGGGFAMGGGFPMGGGYAMGGGFPMGGGYAMGGGFPVGGGVAVSGGFAMGGGFPMGGGYAAGGGFPMGGGYAAGGGFPMGGGYAAGGGFPMGGGYAMGGGFPMGGGVAVSGGFAMGGGFPMGGGYAAGGGFPMGGGYAAGGGFPMGGGAAISGGFAMGGGFPMGGGYAAGGGFPMSGGFTGGFQGGGFQGGGYMPGAGLDTSQLQMQMYQQQMQMQMQLQQQQLQAQMRAQENFQARYRVVAGLQTELQSLQFRLQQAYSSLYTSGYGGFELGGSVQVGGGLSGSGVINPGPGVSGPTVNPSAR